MGYSRKLNPEKFEGLEKVIESLQALEPGEGFSARCESPEDLVKTRLALYDFLFHMELKSKFRLKVLSPRELLIQRLGFKTVPSVVKFGEKVPEATGMSKTMIERLIELWGGAEAEAQLNAWVEAKALSKEEGTELWEHVMRIMS